MKKIIKAFFLQKLKSCEAKFDASFFCVGLLNECTTNVFGVGTLIGSRNIGVE